MPHPGLAGQRRLSARSMRRICASYGLGEVTRFAPLAAGTLNCNYTLETTHGRYFVKHHVDMRPADLMRQHRLLQTVQANGLAVAAPLPDAHDRTFLTVYRRPVVVFPWIDGQHRSHGALTDDACYAIGALLGRTHRALAEAGDGEQQPFLLPPIRPEYTLVRAFDLLDRVRAQQSPDPFDALAEAYLTFTIEHLRVPGHAVGLHPCVTTWQWTHGDFHPGNVIFGQDGAMTMIDWDKARVQPRLFELVRSIVLWLADRETGSVDLQAAWSMMRGYATWTRVEPGVVPEIVDYFWWSKLNQLWILDRHYSQSDRTTDDLLASTLGWLRWLLAHRHDLALALADAANVDTGPSSP
jgi:homoserine kinase type II